MLDDRELGKKISAGDAQAFDAWYREASLRLHIVRTRTPPTYVRAEVAVMVADSCNCAILLRRLCASNGARTLASLSK